jgi:hypothetical protein
MLSQFCYAAFNELLDRRAAGHGVELRRVNPAFTSILEHFLIRLFRIRHVRISYGTHFV